MVATPAWPPRSTPRLFVEQALAEGATVHIDGPQAHYLNAVMRLKVGDPLKLCDDRTGEWLGVVETLAKRDLVVRIEAKLREREAVPDLWLAVAPIRKARFDFVAEKACELGVDRFLPVMMARCVADKVKPDRLRAQMIEAAEQCGRTALPSIADPVSLKAFLAGFPEGRTLIFADEMGGTPLPEVAASCPSACIIVGPEGGFTDEERAAILAHPASVGVSLGPRILRADTAALASVAVWMAAQQDG
jgi:16S rRNA (uracil1498-N3)-methyltransferase